MGSWHKKFLCYSEPMVYLILLSCLVLIPLLLIVLLKSHGAIAFMSLCLGSVLMTYVASDMTDVATSMQSGQSPAVVSQIVKIVLLVTPFVLAVLFTAGSVRGGRQLLNVLLAASSGILLLLLLVPLLSATVQQGIHAQAAWHQLSSLQTMVIILGASVSLLFLLSNKPERKESKKRGK